MSTPAPFFMKSLYARTSMFKTKIELAKTRSIPMMLSSLTALRPIKISTIRFRVGLDDEVECAGPLTSATGERNHSDSDKV